MIMVAGTHNVVYNGVYKFNRGVYNGVYKSSHGIYNRLVNLINMVYNKGLIRHNNR